MARAPGPRRARRQRGWARRVDLVVLGVIALLAAAAGAALHYHGQRLETAQLDAHRQFAEIDAHHGSHFLAQTLNTVELTLHALLASDPEYAHPGAWPLRLQDALRNAPHLRSLSLVDARGEVIASSRPANLGRRLDLAAYLPRTEPGEAVLRIGPAHAGRDLADGRPLPAAPADAGGGSTDPGLDLDAGFVPVALSLGHDRDTAVTLVAALNADFFRSRLSDLGGKPAARIDVLRYDGALLLSTQDAPAGGQHAANQALARLWQAERWSGTLLQEIGGEGRWITAYRSDALRPFAVVARIDQAEALAGARAEARLQQAIVLPLIALGAAALLLAYLVLRRATRRRFQTQAEQGQRLAALLDALPACVLLVGPDGRMAAANRAWRDMARDEALRVPERLEDLHYLALAGFLGRDPLERGGPGLDEGIAGVLAGDGEHYEGGFTGEGPNGPRSWRIVVRPFACEGRRCALLLQLDVTAQQRTAERLRLLDAALDAADNAVVITDADAVIEWANPAFSRLTGYALHEAIGRRPKELVRSGLQPAEFYAQLWGTILAGKVWRGELVNRRRSGELYHEALTITPLADAQGRLSHFIAVKEDISERKRQEQALERLATTDALTGVLNRRAFLERLAHELDRSRRSGSAGALLMLDLDHFKQINDRHGHAMGDTVLVSVCCAVGARLRRTDALGRLGGEEFAVLLPETDAGGAGQLAQELLRCVQALRIEAAPGPIAVTVSIGLVHWRSGDADGASLLQRADEALYRAKAQGRNRVVVGERVPQLTCA